MPGRSRRILVAALLAAAVVVGPAGATFPGYNGRIAFASSRPSNEFGHIWTINPDGTDEHQVTTSYAGEPAWSPDGTKLLITRNVGRTQIFVIDADGSNEVPLTTEGYNAGPAWSPDGSTIAFASTRPCNASGCAYNLWVMDADGGNPHQIWTGNFSARSPDWSAAASSGSRSSGRSGKLKEPRRLPRGCPRP